jgi:hypothetical protein
VVGRVRVRPCRERKHGPQREVETAREGG